MLSDIPGVAAYIDDVLITAPDQEALLHRLTQVFERIQSYGFRLRAEKCEFFLTSIKFLGFIIDSTGRPPDPENISAIRSMPAPSDVPTLRSFLGLVSHYSNFLPHMHRLRDPLNRLLRNDASWHWSEECQTAFDEMKNLLSSDLLLTHYDPALDIVVASDASNYGIGAVLSHVYPDGSEKAVMHAARSLNTTERNYSQIEKEALAIIFAMKKFHKMLYGRHFTILTDHKPLLSIFGSKKGIPVYTANRLQRWAIMLLGYDFSIKYQSTESIGQADALSRLIESQRQKPEDSVVASIFVEPEIHHVLATSIRALPITSTMIRQETAMDVLLQEVVRYHRSHWPSHCSNPAILPFFKRRSSLSEVDECLLFLDRVVVPNSLQAAVLKQFHIGHPGINRMKSIARSYVFWPNLDSEIEKLVNSCSKCQLNAKMPRKSELFSWPIPDSPWSRLHIDFAGPVNGQHYLIVVDAFSKWPEVCPVERTTSTVTISKLRSVFSRFGMPHTIVSDNGTAFTSAEFSEFCDQNGIQHIRSPPFHPQSNGQVERFVDTFKRSLLKLQGEGTTPEILETFLLCYRSTANPSAPNGKSPSELLMNRHIRLPVDVIRPTDQSSSIRNTTMERQFNRHHGAKKSSYVPGQSVLAADYRSGSPKWTPGTIVRKRGNIVYEVDVHSAVWIRHANQLRSTPIEGPRPRDSTIPLDILLDTFELVQTANTHVPNTPNEHSVCAPRRWTDRVRRSVTPLQLNPRLPSYEQRLSRGGVRRATSNRHL